MDRHVNELQPALNSTFRTLEDLITTE